jgi:glycosyltransferase involved in cell wall biosynthesis
MRIAMMTYSIIPRGGVVHASRLAEHLADLDVEVELFALCNTNGMELENEIKFYRPLNIPYSIYPFTQQSQDVIAYVKQMINEYEENLPNDFDIYHTHDCVGANALCSLKSTNKINVPTVRTIHHLDSFQNTEIIKFQKRAALGCDHKLVVSRFWQDYFKENLNIEAQITYNGVNTKAFNPEVDGSDIRKKYGIEVEPVILFVGGLEKRKGLEYLLFAMQRIKREIPNIRLIVVGKDAFSSLAGERTFFDILIKRLDLEDHVDFEFHVSEENIPKYYAACDVYALPSNMEGWGLSLMEAMATKKPVVATRVGGIPELVDDRVNGFLCESGDIHCLSKKIIYLLKNKDIAEDMGKAGYDKSQTYTWERTARKVKDIYEFILNGK